MNYRDVLRASDKEWQAEAREFLEKGHQFVVIKITVDVYRDCIALAQEFDYSCVVEDQGEDRELVLASYPDTLPQKLGFVPRRILHPKKPN